jgi:PPP family 3-phenylpropionic acid transporter
MNFAKFFLAYFGYISVFSPYASLYFAERGVSAAQIGVLMSLMQVLRIFGPNLWGWVADHSSRRVMALRVTSAAATATFCGMFWGETFGFFFALMLVLNLFTSAQGPLSEALILSAMRGDLTHYGRLRLWGLVGFIVLVTVSGQLLGGQSVRMTPWISLVMLVTVAVIALNLREETSMRVHHEAPSVRKLLQQRDVMAFFASTLLMIAVHASMYVYYSLYLADIGYSETVIGLMWSLGVIAEIAFFYRQAPLFRRYGVRKLMIASLAIGVVRFLMTELGAESLVLLLVVQLLHAATFGVHHSASVATMQRWFAGPLQARGQALYISISFGLGGTVGGLMMSAYWDTLGARPVYVIAAALCLLGWIAAKFSYRWQAQSAVMQRASGSSEWSRT